MATQVLIPSPFRRFVGGRASVEVEAATVGEALSQLAAAHPDLQRQLYDTSGRMRSFVTVYVNDENIRHLAQEATPLGAGDVLSLVPAIAGGRDDDADEGDAVSAAGLNSEEILRYSRHLIMSEVAVEGQLKLKAAKVLLIGAGGLGSPAGLYLAAAGVGRIGIVDFDVVDTTNLQRQVCFGNRDVGRPKAEAARDRLRELNPQIEVVPHVLRLASDNALDLIRGYDLVVDGTDNFPTRYLVNDACLMLGVPYVYGSIYRFEGQASVFGLAEGPCYRCLHPEPPPAGLVPSCAEGGVLGVLPGVVGAVQATEAIKLILGAGELLAGRLWLFDALGMRSRELRIRRNSECPACGPQRALHRLLDYDEFCGVRGAAAPARAPVAEITAARLRERLEAEEALTLVDVREPHETRICGIGGLRIPLSDLAARVHELDSACDIVVYCRNGQRSVDAAEFLRESGFARVWSLKHGLHAWADEVDASLPKY